MFWKATKLSTGTASNKLELEYTVGELIGSQLSKNVKMIWLAKRLVFIEKHPEEHYKNSFQTAGITFSSLAIGHILSWTIVYALYDFLVKLSEHCLPVVFRMYWKAGPSWTCARDPFFSTPQRYTRTVYCQVKVYKNQVCGKDKDDDIAYVRT
jgi:hypothetical protein